MAQEIELKLLLADHADYVTVLTALSHLATAEVQDQTNYYLDTNRLNLRASRAMLRVRVQGQQAKVTVKAKATLQDGIQQALELEQNLPPEIAQAWCKTPPSHSTPATLAVLPWLCGSEAVLQPPLPVDAALHVLGAMQTTRRCFSIARNVLSPRAPDEVVRLELDHTRFGTLSERFEIELEHPLAAQLRTEIDAWLDGLDVQAEAAEESKYAQFLRLFG